MAVAFGIEDSDGTVLAISVYSDGIAEHAGHTVAKHYATWELAEALIALGDLSWVGMAIGSQTDFKEAHERQGYVVPAQCLAYARDRGEPWEHNQPRRFTSREQYRRMQGFNGWHHLFDRKAGQWLTYRCSRWMPVNLPS